METQWKTQWLTQWSIICYQLQIHAKFNPPIFKHDDHRDLWRSTEIGKAKISDIIAKRVSRCYGIKRPLCALMGIAVLPVNAPIWLTA